MTAKCNNITIHDSHRLLNYCKNAVMDFFFLSQILNTKNCKKNAKNSDALKKNNNPPFLLSFLFFFCLLFQRFSRKSRREVIRSASYDDRWNFSPSPPESRRDSNVVTSIKQNHQNNPVRRIAGGGGGGRAARPSITDMGKTRIFVIFSMRLAFSSVDNL